MCGRTQGEWGSEGARQQHLTLSLSIRREPFTGTPCARETDMIGVSRKGGEPADSIRASAGRFVTMSLREDVSAQGVA